MWKEFKCYTCCILSRFVFKIEIDTNLMTHPGFPGGLIFYSWISFSYTEFAEEFMDFSSYGTS